MVKCRMCGLEFSDPVIEFHEQRCTKKELANEANKKTNNSKKGKDETKESNPVDVDDKKELANEAE